MSPAWSDSAVSTKSGTPRIPGNANSAPKASRPIVPWPIRRVAVATRAHRIAAVVDSMSRTRPRPADEANGAALRANANRRAEVVSGTAVIWQVSRHTATPRRGPTRRHSATGRAHRKRVRRHPCAGSTVRRTAGTGAGCAQTPVEHREQAARHLRSASRADAPTAQPAWTTTPGRPIAAPRRNENASARRGASQCPLRGHPKSINTARARTAAGRYSAPHAGTLQPADERWRARDWPNRASAPMASAAPSARNSPGRPPDTCAPTGRPAPAEPASDHGEGDRRSPPSSTVPAGGSMADDQLALPTEGGGADRDLEAEARRRRRAWPPVSFWRSAGPSPGVAPWRRYVHGDGAELESRPGRARPTMTASLAMVSLNSSTRFTLNPAPVSARSALAYA